jgi:hypothetical protein
VFYDDFEGAFINREFSPSSGVDQNHDRGLAALMQRIVDDNLKSKPIKLQDMIPYYGALEIQEIEDYWKPVLGKSAPRNGWGKKFIDIGSLCLVHRPPGMVGVKTLWIIGGRYLTYGLPSMVGGKSL